jgi:hypothetical protein
MNTRKLDRDFFDLIQHLKENSDLRILSFHYPNAIDEASRQALEKVELPRSLAAFLSKLNGLELRWENARQVKTFIEGSINILPATAITKHWDKAIYFGDGTAAAGGFYPVDFFADEACCGVLADGQKGELHYYAFSSGEEPYNLGIDIAGYLSLAIEAKCYRFWPLVVKLIVEKESSPLIQKFNDDMAVLFPEFSVEKFINQYRDLRNR